MKHATRYAAFFATLIAGCADTNPTQPFSELSSDPEVRAAQQLLVHNQVDLFESHSFQAPGLQDNNHTLGYRLFVPKNSDSGAPKRLYPLLLWLHGHGEAGSDNKKHIYYIATLVARWEKRRDGFPAFVLAPQCPSDNPSWYHSRGEDPDGRDMLTVAKKIVTHIVKTQPIDPQQIYVAGVSSGGSGTWEMAIRYPDLFAAAVPLSSSGGDTSRISRLAQMPVWAFHVTEDRGSSPEPDRNSVAELNAAGGYSVLTEIPGTSHNSWTPAFYDYDVIGWMLKQRRETNGSTQAVPPTIESWTEKALAGKTGPSLLSNPNQSPLVPDDE